MTKVWLLKELKRLETLSKEDAEIAHMDADKALLTFINDAEIAAAFKAIRKWYA